MLLNKILTNLEINMEFWLIINQLDQLFRKSN